MNHGYSVYSTNIRPSSSVIGSLPLINPSPAPCSRGLYITYRLVLKSVLHAWMACMYPGSSSSKSDNEDQFNGHALNITVSQTCMLANIIPIHADIA